MTHEEPPAPPDPGRPCCEKFAERISDLHDGRWPAGSGDCAKVEEHLATCPRCAEFLDDYRLLSKAAEALRAAEVSPDCAEVMRRRVRARIRGQIFRRRLKWTGAGVAVAAAASVAVAVAMLPDSDVPGPEGPVAVAGEDRPGDEPKDDTKDEEPGQIDLLKNPAVAALLEELEEEADLGSDAGDDRPGTRMPIQEEIDLRRDWDVRPVHGIEFLMPGGDLDGFRLDLRPRGRPLVRPGVVPVGGDGR
ncbi:MAG: anti-sigma factor family protein [Planctomycetota bacterium]|jgi:hypothetical protein